MLNNKEFVKNFVFIIDSGQFIMISQEITGVSETGPNAFSFWGVFIFL